VNRPESSRDDLTLLMVTTVWVPESRSRYAACEHSPIKSPKRSRRATRLPVTATNGCAGRSGAACPTSGVADHPAAEDGATALTAQYEQLRQGSP
jgi:hypothetical protein